MLTERGLFESVSVSEEVKVGTEKKTTPLGLLN